MNKDTFDESSRFFRSFAAGDLPLRPLDEVDFDQIGDLVSFYVADYDESDKLIRFRKFLNTEGAPPTQCEVVFTERYEYWPDGAVRCRTLIRADGNEQQWIFERSKSAEEQALKETAWRLLCSCHQRLSKIAEAMNRGVRDSRLQGRELSFEMGKRLLRDAEGVLQDAVRDPGLTLAPLGFSDTGVWMPLVPASFPVGFSGPLTSTIEPLVLKEDAPVLFPSTQELRRAFPEGGEAFQEQRISAVAAASVRMRADRDVQVAMLTVLGTREWDAGDQECIVAILARVSLLFEILLEIGRREDSLQQDTTSPEFGGSKEIPGD